MNNPINEGVIVRIDLIFIQFLDEFIQNPWIDGEIHSLLSIDPMR